MSSSELLLTFLVALLVFGPNKLPMLAEHLGKLLRQLNYYKQQANLFWQTQLNEQHLRENRQKAEQADKVYLYEKAIVENSSRRKNGSGDN
ncbi:twin arginine translocase protein A [Legionella massiliensis]|uniref:Twin arginine translocase protein A n=1 Tax=Legionella massiliensis TaxID=1034943 RepID=A0A078KWL0_9GAMM|nr:twin-arginine translocase TatA/TatE family subunit [Legionella massiliensis]CDZ76093.1 twin arginine translocase protein A [Legionella massiliensis]CEE11831.1 Sec-independent protein translocase protein TatB [Legionella massiliensis]